MRETFEGFNKLWRGRNSDHISLVEIEAYVRLFDVPQVDRFADLILACDQAIWDTKEEVADKKEKLRKLNQRTKS